MIGKLAVVIQLVGAVVPLIERVFGAGRGAEKKQAAMSLVQRLLEVAGISASPGILRIIDESIDVVVAVYNEVLGSPDPKPEVRKGAK